LVTQTNEDLDITIVTGLSGAGRSEAANVLEDLGFFVIDNLPPLLIPKVAGLARAPGRAATRYALGADIRSGALEDLHLALEQLREAGARTRILFLEAADDVLVRRYEASRRKHPLGSGERMLEAIAEERALLEPLKAEADVVIDTTQLNVHQLRDRLRDLFAAGPAEHALQTNIVSFGFKHGLPLDVDLVFDCRFLPNPHWVESLRPLRGTDAKVRRYVMKQDETEAFLAELERLFALLLPAYVKEGKSYLSIGVGCTGGHHRSVVLAEELARTLERLGFPARVHHRDLERG
jgi:RNase adapter protein RapZ